MRFMYLWNADDWPNFKLDAQALQPALAAARVAQGRMLGMASSLQLVDLDELQLTEWSQDAMATARIEGEMLQLNSVRTSAARRLGLTQSSRALQISRQPQAEATLDLIEAAYAHWAEPLSDERLGDWHAALFPTGRSGVTRIHVGGYRVHAEPMQIVTPRQRKPDTVHYQAPASADVPVHMARFIAWFNREGEAQRIDGIARAALAHVWFETIHPFEDGNGRIGRAISDKALAQDMKNGQRLFSVSQQMWLDRKGYYGQLQAATGKADLDVTPWVIWFVGCLEKACLASVAHMQAAASKTRFWADLRATHPGLSSSQSNVIAKLFDAGPDKFEGGMSTEKYVHIAGVSRATAYRELTALVASGLLEKTGVGRGTRYQRVTGTLT